MGSFNCGIFSHTQLSKKYRMLQYRPVRPANCFRSIRPARFDLVTLRPANSSRYSCQAKPVLQVSIAVTTDAQSSQVLATANCNCGMWPPLREKDERLSAIPVF